MDSVDVFRSTLPLSREGLQGLFLMAIMTQSYTEILRLKCATYANFSEEEKGKRLENAFKTFYGIDKPQCQYECIMDDTCKTMNINEDETICELNNKSTEDVRDNVAAVADSGWTYYSTRYNESRVGRNCVEKNPCKEGWKCYDQCQCPGYSCIRLRSCLDWYRAGARTTGRYYILGNTSYPVFCDFESEINSVWTLVMSYSLKNKEIFRKQFYEDFKQNASLPNWDYYRLGLRRMKKIRAASSMWRATCSFPKYKSDIYRDYVRARLADIDILEFRGVGECRKVDRISIREHNASNITVPFWQEKEFSFHTDSKEKRCNFNATKGSVRTEDNFGFYYSFNPEFRCTESANSTTQYWFGGIV